MLKTKNKLDFFKNSLFQTKIYVLGGNSVGHQGTIWSGEVEDHRLPAESGGRGASLEGAEAAGGGVGSAAKEERRGEGGDGAEEGGEGQENEEAGGENYEEGRVRIGVLAVGVELRVRLRVWGGSWSREPGRRELNKYIVS